MAETQSESLLQKLMRERLISAEQAEIINKKMEEEGGNVVEHLLAESILEEKKIISFLVNRCGYHYINLSKIEIDPHAVAELPVDLIKKFKVLPIRCVKNMLAIAMMDPLDAATQTALSQATVLRVLPFVSPRQQLWDNIVRLAGNNGSAPGAEEDWQASKPEPAAVKFGMPLVAAYRFESFVVGTGNEFPYAMAVAVAKAQGKTYNPLLLYSDVGLGKTHLMNAIGNYIKGERPTIKIMYATSEYFCSKVVAAMKENLLDEFRENCRLVDLLLIDDIQFLRGRNRAQEEFFHIFNSMVQNDKQVVVTSDRPPSELTVLEKRLQSRFMGGSIACIEPPDMETRLAILEKKCSDVTIPQDVKRILAESFNNSIRDLEGALKTLLSFHRFTKKPINKELVQRTLQEMGR